MPKYISAEKSSFIQQCQNLMFFGTLNNIFFDVFAVLPLFFM